MPWKKNVHNACLVLSLITAVGGGATEYYLRKDAGTLLTEPAKKAYQLESEINAMEQNEYKLRAFDQHTSAIRTYNAKKQELELLMQEPETTASIQTYRERIDELFPLKLTAILGFIYGFGSLALAAPRKKKKQP
ncbi:MAG: hypothetical protein V1734_02705 [Nanoarchaeota archaeon]